PVQREPDDGKERGKRGGDDERPARRLPGPRVRRSVRGGELHDTLSTRDERGAIAISSAPARGVKDSPVQKSVTAPAPTRTVRDSGVSSQLNRHSMRAPGSVTVPSRSEASSKAAATPVGGRSFLSMAGRAGGRFVKSPPEIARANGR